MPTGRNAGPRSCIHGKTVGLLHTAVLCVHRMYVCVCAVYWCVGMCYAVLCCVDMLCIRVFLLVRVCYFGNLFGISTNEAQFSWLF